MLASGDFLVAVILASSVADLSVFLGFFSLWALTLVIDTEDSFAVDCPLPFPWAFESETTIGGGRWRVIVPSSAVGIFT